MQDTARSALTLLPSEMVFSLLDALPTRDCLAFTSTCKAFLPYRDEAVAKALLRYCCGLFVT